MPHSFEQEREAEKIALAEKLEGQLKTLIFDSKIPLKEVVRMLGAQEFYEEVGKGDKKGRVFHFKDWAKEEVRIALEKSNTTSLPLDETIIHLPDSGEQLNETILPAGKGEIMTGSGIGIEAKKEFPRTRLLIELLTEMQLPYDLKIGKNTPDMMRGLSYSEVLIPTINKIVYVNDEEDNATYVIHNIQDEEEKAYFRKLNKEELKEFTTTGKVSYLEFDQSSFNEWKKELKTILEKNNGEIIDKKIDTKIDKDKLLPAPEGWMTNRALSRLLKVEFVRTKDVATELFPGLDMKTPNYIATNRPAFHFSPEQIEKISEKIKEEKGEYLPAPEGWMTNKTLTKIFGVGQNRITNKAEELFPGLDVKTPNYLNKFNKPAFHFSPDQIEKIKEKIGEYSPAPEGYLTRRALADILETYHQLIKIIALELFPGLDIKTPNFLDKGKHPAFHFSPEQIKIITERVKIITEEMKKYELAPKGYMTIHRLGKILHLSEKTIIKKAVKLFPEIDLVTPNYLISKGHPAFHFSPEQIEIIRKEVESNKK